jgi:hypothetical protein
VIGLFGVHSVLLSELLYLYNVKIYLDDVRLTCVICLQRKDGGNRDC